MGSPMDWSAGSPKFPARAKPTPCLSMYVPIMFEMSWRASACPFPLRLQQYGKHRKTIQFVINLFLLDLWYLWIPLRFLGPWNPMKILKKTKHQITSETIQKLTSIYIFYIQWNVIQSELCPDRSLATGWTAPWGDTMNIVVACHDWCALIRSALIWPICFDLCIPAVFSVTCD